MGLVNGQYRRAPGIYKLTHNSCWFDRSGLRLGWGDLDIQDCINIIPNLHDGEKIYILSEEVARGSLSNRYPDYKHIDSEKPGREFCSNFSAIKISRKKLVFRFYRGDAPNTYTKKLIEKKILEGLRAANFNNLDFKVEYFTYKYYMRLPDWESTYRRGPSLENWKHMWKVYAREPG